MKGIRNWVVIVEAVLFLLWYSYDIETLPGKDQRYHRKFLITYRIYQIYERVLTRIVSKYRRSSQRRNCRFRRMFSIFHVNGRKLTMPKDFFVKLCEWSNWRWDHRRPHFLVHLLNTHCNRFFYVCYSHLACRISSYFSSFVMVCLRCGYRMCNATCITYTIITLHCRSM